MDNYNFSGNEEREYQRFESAAKLILSLFLISVLVIYMAVTAMDKDKETYQLTIAQQTSILKQLGKDGYVELVKNGCSSAIAVKINTGRWSDYYCAERYDKLDLK